MSNDFKIWWHNEGSGMPPFKDQETCDHVERVSAIAWSNGAFKATLSLDADNARLKDEVERLRKAGDDLYKSMLEIGCNEMADNFQYDAWWGSMKAWNAAKEGKPSV